MPDQFANPLGFLGLLAIPAILAIHFLREKSRRVRLSTLFLLERVEPRTPTGRTIQKLQNSVPLWLQLLIAMLCTWLLVQPLWLRSDSRQRVTVVLDSTASMSAVRARVLSELPEVLRKIGKAAAQTDWVLSTADRPESPLYTGTDLTALRSSLQNWDPLLPDMDPSRAFSVTLLDARGGPVFYVSDREPGTLPGGVTLLAFGEPIENAGFAGVRTWREKDEVYFEALVRNSGSQTQEREFWIETERFQSQPQRITLKPGEITTIPGPFPSGEKQILVKLSGDAFSLDDTLPLVAPEPKPMTVAIRAGENGAKFAERLLPTLPGVQRGSDPSEADVVLSSQDRIEALPPGKDAIVFGGSTGSQAVLTAPITTEQHAIHEGAKWNGLLSSGPGEFNLSNSDQPLVWQQGKPLIILRIEGGARRLFLNFDFEHSNAGRLPATVLLLSRFIVDAQQRKLAPFAENFETHQTLPIRGGEKLEITTAAGETTAVMGSIARAPLRPGFFNVQSGEVTLMRGSARFGDAREGEFLSAQSSVSNLDRSRLIQRANLAEDRLAGLWMALLGAALAGSWYSQARMSRS